MKKIISFIILCILSQNLLTSCSSQSACDCANLVKDKTESWDNAAKNAENGNGIVDFDNNAWLRKGKDCMEEYSKMKDWEIDAYQNMGNLISDEAIDNASMECGKEEKIDDSDGISACDCYENSYLKTQIPYDELTSDDEKELRKKCHDKYLGKDEVMKMQCEQK